MTPIRIPSRAAGIAPAHFDILNARAAELRARGHEVISLGQALPGFGPPAAAVDAVRAAMADPAAHVYSADAGRPALREALADALRRSQRADVTRDEVIITAGGNQAFMLALLTLIDAGDEVLLPAPYFVNHEMAVRAVGGVPREVPVPAAHGFALTWDHLEGALSAGTRAVVVCTPSNPTGAVVVPDEMRRIAAGLAARGILLVVDETYGRFVYEGGFESAAARPGWRENVVVVNTFSKSFAMTGWRVGYLLAPPHVCEQAIKIHDAMVICAPVPSQIGVEAAIRGCWDYPDRFVPSLRERRGLLADRLGTIDRLAWTPAGGGFFAFVRVEGCSDAASLATEILERAHVVTIPGSSFGACGEGHIRLSYSAVSGDELLRAADRLQAFFAG